MREKSNHTNSFLRRKWRELLPSLIRERLRSCLGRPAKEAQGCFQTLDRMGNELDKHIASGKIKKSVKILFGPSFSIHLPCFVHDRILSYSLRLRGAEVIPVYCDSIQSCECNFYGGVWKPFSFAEACRNCVNWSKRLWENSPVPPVVLSGYLKNDEIKKISDKAAALDPEEWMVYSEDGLPFGLWAKDILVNNYTVSDYRLVPNHEALGPIHLRNLLLLKGAFERILDELKPDRVISNDSYYGMWAVLERLCERKGIPFYSQWPALSLGKCCYARWDAAMNLNFSKAWKNFLQSPLKNRQKKKIQKWLQRNTLEKKGKTKEIYASKEYREETALQGLNPEKPIALMPANIVWDLSSLNKQIVFPGVMDWIAETAEWFKVHPEFQLIIKAHPTELDPLLPPTKERIEVALAQRKVRLPKNVFLLPPRSKVTVYQLFPIIQAGIVHTTTTGAEMAAVGLPVITTARAPYRGFGFTMDPNTRGEYFEFLEKALCGKKILNTKTQKDLAYKYILFHNHHYYMDLGDIAEPSRVRNPRLKIRSIKELFPGRNRLRDYVSDSIMKGLPIVSEDRWPPES